MDHVAPIDRYWYIYEANDIDLSSGGWSLKSSTIVEWARVTPEDEVAWKKIMRTGWDGTGDWYERDQDQEREASTYPLVQAVRHVETGKQHLVSLVPFPERGEPRFVFYLPYMPFFIEPAERDERYQAAEGV